MELADRKKIAREDFVDFVEGEARVEGSTLGRASQCAGVAVNNVLCYVLKKQRRLKNSVRCSRGDLEFNEGEWKMTVYMVERELKGITMDQLAAAQRRAIETSNEFSNKGTPVRYIRSTFVPGEERSMCLFEASNQDVVRDVNDEAQIPYVRIIEALDLTP